MRSDLRLLLVLAVAICGTGCADAPDVLFGEAVSSFGRSIPAPPIACRSSMQRCGWLTSWSQSSLLQRSQQMLADWRFGTRQSIKSSLAISASPPSTWRVAGATPPISAGMGTVYTGTTNAFRWIWTFLTLISWRSR
jgi:hypothetical protein